MAVVASVALVAVGAFTVFERTALSQDASPALSARSSLAVGAASSKIAFTESTFGGQQSGGLFVVNSDGSGKRRLADAHHATPSWSPDGQRIAFGDGTTSTSFTPTGAASRT